MTILRPCIFNGISRSFVSSSRASCETTPSILFQRQIQLRRLSSANRLLKKEDVSPQEDKTESREESSNRKRPQKNAVKASSLRSVATVAQKSRTSFVRLRGRQRFVDPDAETKTITAYCAAETYNMRTAVQLVQAEGYEVDPLQTGLSSQVIHIRTSDRPSEVKDYQQGDIFVFSSGTVVAWNVREREAIKLVNHVLTPAASGPHPDSLETEDLDYLEDPSRPTSSVVGDTIVLGTQAEEPNPDVPRETGQDNLEHRHEIDLILAKIAFSSGLARSTKLAVLETLLSDYQASTREIPNMLASNKTSIVTLTKRANTPFTRSFILRKTGELLSIRAQLNLYSELTDSMPDIFWDSRHELGLGEYYDQVGRALDINARIRTLNERIGFAQEIASALREQLSEKHGLRLEWAIIALIAVEVVLEFFRHWTEHRERNNPDSTESLLREYLLKLAREEK